LQCTQRHQYIAPVIIAPTVLCGGLQVAGADGKMDKPEFVNLFRTLLGKIQGDPAPVAHAAAAAGYQA
jgi:hypothetical protein